MDRQDSFSGTTDVRDAHRFDETKLDAWMQAHVVDYAGPLTVQQFKGGQSNPTYKLNTPLKNYVLRRKPPGELLASAHAVDREYKVITALGKTDVPVAKTYGLCTDDSIIGTWFYIMECVEGRVIWGPTFPDVSSKDRPLYFKAMIDALAKLHKADYVKIGLGDYGKTEGYMARQIHRWSKQYLADPAAGKFDEMDKLCAWLPSSIPSSSTGASTGVSIVHGDYRCDNMIFHPTEPKVLAILDWELSTLGDPMADFTYHLMMYHMPSSMTSGISDVDFTALNIPSQSDYISWYAQATGRPAEIPDIHWYLAYNIFRLAAICHGIQGRVVKGTAASAHAKSMGAAILPLAQFAFRQAKLAGAE
jgi:aminoglycoside phosphotransferase (APT) family kinase protein